MTTANSCARSILDKFDISDFKAELNGVSGKFKEVSISSFRNRVCVDCGDHLKTHGAVRCKSCNMRKVGRERQRQRRLGKK
jgi:hypothetical protein